MTITVLIPFEREGTFRLPKSASIQEYREMVLIPFKREGTFRRYFKKKSEEYGMKF